MAQSTPAQSIATTAGISIRPTHATTGWTTTAYPANTGPMLIRAINNATHGKDSTLQFWNKEGNIDFLLRQPTGQPTAQGIFSISKSTASSTQELLSVMPGTTTDYIALRASTVVYGPLSVTGDLLLDGSPVLNFAELANWLPLNHSTEAMIWGPNATGTGTFTISIGTGSISNSSMSIGENAVSGSGVSGSTVSDATNRKLSQPSTWSGGTNGIALGKSTFAGPDAVALGTYAAARNAGFAGGYRAQAYGQSSIALGDAFAGGLGSFASGSTLTTSGSSSRPEALGEGSFAYGRGRVRAEGASSMAFGSSLTATYGGSTAIGSHSLAFGRSMYVHGDYSHAFGTGQTVDADYSFAAGANSSSSGSYNVSFGHDQEVVGDYNYTFGQEMIVTADGTFGVGSSLRAIGNNSWMMGESLQTNGDFSSAIGKGIYTLDTHAFIIGRYNQDVGATPSGNRYTDWISDSALFVLGNGTSTSVRSNAFVVRKNGDTDVNGKIKVQGDAELSGDTTTVSGVLILTTPAGGIAVAEEFDDTP